MNTILPLLWIRSNMTNKQPFIFYSFKLSLLSLWDVQSLIKLTAMDCLPKTYVVLFCFQPKAFREVWPGKR